MDAALRPGGTLDPLDEGSAGRVEDWLSNPATDAPARLERIALVSGDPEDLTLRHARWLGEADAIYHDTDVPPAIVARARADAARHPLDAAPDVPLEGFAVILTRD